ncbi:CDP-alcohol phosphatidyltransferase family protein [Pygmaiobacter massiliensis]|uniref:CDP-alcohol phosphatidyltransferase family protein n=1 Tax=Pygmaiobacter massiliensis TaxID=1917873 RepID=UPI002A82158C|nr:CDP-alcohol phosphatidyltransferase family protein [Pygmaiobacter massiliensis]MDY4785260.1 CDP-alcohol phosphatidyltransferase family protein [Pygmaiobacter massiliensis]
MMNQLANVITSTRFFFAVIMVCAEPFSGLFWAAYAGGGLSDVLDGVVARRLNQQTELGAKMDSFADIAFGFALFIFAVKSKVLPRWIWMLAAIIFVLRVFAYGAGYYKYGTFSSLHTYLNKATGLLIFLFPVAYMLFGMTATGLLVGALAFASAVEEFILTLKEPTLNRNRKSMFMK